MVRSLLVLGRIFRNSTVLELIGTSLIVAGVWTTWGLGAGLIVAGVGFGLKAFDVALAQKGQ